MEVNSKGFGGCFKQTIEKNYICRKLLIHYKKGCGYKYFKKYKHNIKRPLGEYWI